MQGVATRWPIALLLYYKRGDRKVYPRYIRVGDRPKIFRSLWDMCLRIWSNKGHKLFQEIE